MSDISEQASADSVAKDGVRPEIVKIFDDVFQHESGLSPQTSRDDIERWDSLQHVALVSSIEDTFKISLSMDEMMEIEKVADIEAILTRHGV